MTRVYRQVGEALVTGAIGPEALVKPRLFQAAVRRASARLEELGEPQETPT